MDGYCAGPFGAVSEIVRKSDEKEIVVQSVSKFLRLNAAAAARQEGTM